VQEKFLPLIYKLLHKTATIFYSLSGCLIWCENSWVIQV
jgi:hypothetical protein